ncbi:polyunsaturated fatty acid lipoxygenase ALOX15B-like [Diretmus argenteus]
MMIYRVIVHPEHFSLSGDAHQTLVQLVGTTGASEFVRSADRSTIVKYKVNCSASLGTLLLVRLQAPPTTTRAWFCSKVAVTTPEGGTSLFPCYRFVSCSTTLVLRDSIESIKADDPNSLPAEVRFSVAKATDLLLTIAEALVELGFEGFLFEDECWTSFNQIDEVLKSKRTETYRFVQKHWKEDCFFGYQFLNGINPTLIRRCTEVPPNFAVNEETLHGLLEGGASLQEEMELKQTPGEDNPVFLPNDAEFDWLTAKTFVRGADFAEHELNAHFLRTHLISEVFAVATLRNFPMVHPLYKLLISHFRYTLEIDTLARNLLISDSGTGFTQARYRSLRIEALDRVDSASRYVEGVVSFYYRDDDVVVRDSELQSWINEIVVFGCLGDEKKGFPKSFSSVKDLVYFVTMVIFNASAQHAAVNNGQIPLGGSAEQLFTEDVPMEMQERFRGDLKILSNEIQARNVGLTLPYVYLDPANVEDSVAR